jgi:hypothetical protein
MTSCKSARCVLDALDSHACAAAYVSLSHAQTPTGRVLDSSWDMVGKRLGVRWLNKSSRAARRRMAICRARSRAEWDRRSSFSRWGRHRPTKLVLSYVHDMHVVLISHHYQPWTVNRPGPVWRCASKLSKPATSSLCRLCSPGHFRCFGSASDTAILTFCSTVIHSL